MVRLVRIEDLAANALIELGERKGQEQVPIEKVVEYGQTVARILEEEGSRVILLISREHTAMLEERYFEIVGGENGDCITLKEGYTVTDLRKSFRGIMPIETFLAFTNSTALAELGIE